MTDADNKRLFLGMEIAAPWPDELPAGRALLPPDRHLTLAFLGEAPVANAKSSLDDLPKPPFSIGLAGYFDRVVFLPKQKPNVAAWRIHWLEQEESFSIFQKELIDWAKDHFTGVRFREDAFLPHVTVARSPVNLGDWKHAFQPLPLFAWNLHLYESLGSSRYQICWTHPMLAPFEETEHTADLAFIVRGSTLSQVSLHAQLALSFHDPALLKYFSSETVSDIDAIVRQLNGLIYRADQQEGSCFKAVSYHGQLRESQTGVLEWEMIVDV